MRAKRNDRRELEVRAEFRRLESRWPELRETLSDTAILAAWLLLGDQMWTTVNVPEAGRGDNNRSQEEVFASSLLKDFV